MHWPLQAAPGRLQNAGGPDDLATLDHNESEPADLMTDAEAEAEIAASEQHNRAASGHRHLTSENP